MHEFAADEPVLPIEIVEPLLGGTAGMGGTICQPFLHPQEVHQLGVVLAGLDQGQIVLRKTSHRCHQREGHAADFAGNIAVGVDQQIDVGGTQGTFSGSGQLSGNILTITYTVSSGANSETCTKTCTKQ